MPKYITSVKLLNSTEPDYQKLLIEMEKKYFYPAVKQEKQSYQSDKTCIFNGTRYDNLFDASSAISKAAANTQKKYFFTIMRDKKKVDS